MSTTTIPPPIIVDLADGWTVRSPTSPAVKARLAESSKSPPSPETLKKNEERADSLRSLHLEAKKETAARVAQRAKAVVAAKLRADASTRQNLLARFEATASHTDEKKKAMLAAKQEKQQRLVHSKHEAVSAARAAVQAEREHRAAVFKAREEAAAAKVEKSLEATVRRNAWHAKSALARATAIKEQQRREAEAAAERLCHRLAAAQSRRDDLGVCGFNGLSVKTPSTVSYDAKLAAKLAEEAAAKKLAAAKEAREEATRKRLEMLKGRASRAAELAPPLEQKEAQKDAAAAKEAAAARVVHFAKLNDADARRDTLLLLRRREGTTATARKATAAIVGSVIDVDVAAFVDNNRRRCADAASALGVAVGEGGEGAGVVLPSSVPTAPPAALLARLVARSEGGAERALLRKARVAGAASRRALRLAAVKYIGGGLWAVKAARAASRRAAALEGTRAASDAKLARAAAFALEVSARRAAAVTDVARRHAEAAERRSHDDEMKRLRVCHAAARRLVASAMRDVVVGGVVGGGVGLGRTAARAAAFLVRRSETDLAVAAQGTANVARRVGAAKRRAARLSARVARAKFAALPRGQPAKLTIEHAGAGLPWVSVVIGPNTDKTTDANDINGENADVAFGGDKATTKPSIWKKEPECLRGSATAAAAAAAPTKADAADATPILSGAAPPPPPLAGWQQEGWKLPNDDDAEAAAAATDDKEAAATDGWELVSEPSRTPSEAAA